MLRTVSLNCYARRPAAIACLLAVLSSTSAMSQQAPVDPMRLAATIEGWRQRPPEMLEACDHARAPDEATRHEMVRDWYAKNASLIEKIDRELPVSLDALPGLTSAPEPSRAFLAGMAMSRARDWLQFSGGTPEGTLLACSKVFRRDFFLWSDERAQHSEEYLAQLIELRQSHVSR